jgi:hypothetical protein
MRAEARGFAVRISSGFAGGYRVAMCSSDQRIPCQATVLHHGAESVARRWRDSRGWLVLLDMIALEAPCFGIPECDGV